MAIGVGKIIYMALALGLLFLMIPTVIMPSFSSSYRFAQVTCWTNTTANCDYDTTVNTTPLTTSQVSCGASEYGAATSYCQRISTAGGYRTANQAIILLLLVVAMIGFAVYFVKKQ